MEGDPEDNQPSPLLRTVRECNFIHPGSKGSYKIDNPRILNCSQDICKTKLVFLNGEGW